MRLYYAPGACSLSPHIVAREAGIALELEKVDLKSKKTESGADYLRINPKGYVPALALDDGSVLTEGPAIVQYLAERKPDAERTPIEAQLFRRLELVERELQNRPFLMGERFTVADAYLFMLLNWAQWTGIDLARWPKLAAFHARVAARPRVQEALQAEGLARKAA